MARRIKSSVPTPGPVRSSACPFPPGMRCLTSRRPDVTLCRYIESIYSTCPYRRDHRAQMLELAILGLLKEAPLHGYELKKRLAETLGHVRGVSYGSLYPALARLERMGAIEVVDPPAAGPAGGIPIPSTGSIAGEAAAARPRRPLRRSGRTRKAYRLAAAGQALFSELIRSESTPGADENRAFALKLAFCRHLDPPV